MTALRREGEQHIEASNNVHAHTRTYIYLIKSELLIRVEWESSGGEKSRRSKLSSQHLEEMKEITFRVPDDMAQLLEEWAKRIPEMEIVRREECLDAALDDIDLRISRTLKVLKDNGAIHYSYDYTWIMVAINDGVVKGMNGFRSPQAFINYLNNFGISKVPCRTIISGFNNKVIGTYPNWEFTDTEDPYEILRRKNVVKQFLSAFNKV